MSDEDQLFMMSNWQALGAWPKGFRKDKPSRVKKAVAFRRSVRRYLEKTWKLDRDITEGGRFSCCLMLCVLSSMIIQADIDAEVAKQKKALRAAAVQKTLQKASDAAAKLAKKNRARAKTR